MMHFAADPGRSKLGFTGAARSAFQFLEDILGFRLVRVEEPTFVRYESTGSFVNVYHSRGGYRVGADIGRFVSHKGERVEDRVSLFEVVAAAGDQEAAEALDVAAETFAAVATAVEEAARLLRTYGAGLLRGDEAAYLEIDQYRRLATERHAAEGARVWEIRKAAHSAWKRGDRAEAQRLLRGLRALTEDEKRMLNTKLS